MYSIRDVLRNFFTHKDFLPPPDTWPGTLFTPLQVGVCAAAAVLLFWISARCGKKSEAYQKKVFLALWAVMVITEVVIGFYDCCAGRRVWMDWCSVLPLWHCSIFLYALPFAVLGSGWVKRAACGYICTLGLFGGMINFVYPANYLSRYSCLSFAGVRTIFYHGAMIFTAVTMLRSKYHSFQGVTRWQQLFLPAIPSLILSVPANFVNFAVPGADYMFFKLDSFFFAPIGRATPDWLSVIVVYILMVLLQAIPYLPSYLTHRKLQA